jgi:hypothetical protein
VFDRNWYRCFLNTLQPCVFAPFFRQVGDSCAAQGVGLLKQQGQQAPDTAELVHALEECHRASAETPRRRAELDRGYKAALNPATNAINSCCLPQGLIKKFPENNLQLMVNSGAKVRRGWGAGRDMNRESLPLPPILCRARYLPT